MSDFGIAVANPGGYNVFEDNPFYFPLDSNQGNVLIKEFTRGGATIGVNEGSPAYQITHNLGYVPLFFVWARDPVTSKWEIIPHFLAPATVPKYAALSDTSKIYISNFDSSTQFKWMIFYDNVVGNSSNSIDLSPGLFIAKPGVNASVSRDPNDFVFHSDFNTLKIIKEASVSVTSTGVGNYAFDHNSPVDKETGFLLFCKFPDGITAFIPGGYGAWAKNVATQYVSNAKITPTQIQFTLGSAGEYKFHYLLFENPLGDNYTWNESLPDGKAIVIAKPGYRADTEVHPDNLRFDSRFSTLKYAVSGKVTVTCSGNNEDKVTEVTIPNTGWQIPLFVPYVNSIFSGGATDQYSFAPHASNTITTKHEATAYVDHSNFYFKLRIKESGAFNYSADFYYKIFQNLLSLN